MYQKNLTEDLRLRLSSKDMDFLRELSNDRQCSVSECIRAILGEYRRSVEMLRTMSKAIKYAEREEAVHGDTETIINNQLQQ